MLTWIITTIALCTAAGVVLAALGLKGRRLDQSPICRRCGFDLRGRFPWSEPTCPTCPDCGEPLLTFRSVMPGVRARRTRLFACGLMLCFPAIIILLAGAADTLAGGATANIKTNTMLAGQVTGNTKGSANLRVLTGRVATGGVSAGDIQPAIEWALSLQANRSLDLDPQWSELLATARRRGQLNPQQLRRYFENAIDWRLLTLPAYADTPLPFAVQAFADRLGQAPADVPVFVTVDCVSAAFGGKPLRFGGTLDRYTTTPRTAALKPGTLVEIVDTAGHNSESGSSNALEFTLSVEVRKGAATGPVVASWTQNLKAMSSVNARDLSQAQRRWQRAEPLSQPTVQEMVAHAKLTNALGINSVHLERDSSGGCWASFTVKPSVLAHDIVATLRITTSDGLTYDGLTPVTISPSDPRWPLLTAADPTASPWSVRVPLNGTPGGGRAIVELVPHLSARAHALSSSIWMGETIRFDGVELRSADPSKP